MDKKNTPWFFYKVLAAFCLWALVFIYRSSSSGLDGSRWWVLFDDGMISMRYALNLTHGFGLTWNPGEYVEGFTNPLWTLVMAGAIFIAGKFYAPLLIQLLGLLLVVYAVFLVKKCADKLLGGDSYWSRFTWLLVLSYYPILYWSLGGMEVSVLSFCMALVLYISICTPSTPYAVWRLYGVIYIAYLIRPDGFLALLPALFIHYYSSSEDTQKLRTYNMQGLLGLAFIMALLTLWRHSYYDELVPNTYILKVSGYDLFLRLQNGAVFIASYLASTIILWLCLGLAVCSRRHGVPKKILIFLGVMPVVSAAYQIYVGGDPWLYWRQLAPSAIPLIMVAAVGLKNVLEDSRVAKKKGVLIILPLLIWASLNGKFIREILGGKPYAFDTNQKSVRTANMLNEVMINGRLLVFWAGTLPYYYEGYAIDALGKADKYIASLPPDYSIEFNGMRGVPGHAKHSLAYSLAKSPDFVQRLSWFGDDYTSLADENYVAITYKGEIACVKKGSVSIRWELVKQMGSCLTYKNGLF